MAETHISADSLKREIDILYSIIDKNLKHIEELGGKLDIAEDLFDRYELLHEFREACK